MSAPATPVYTNMDALSCASEVACYTPTSGKKAHVNRILISGDQAGAYLIKDTTAVSGTVNQTVEVYLKANDAQLVVDLVPKGMESVILGMPIKSGNILTITGPGSSHATGTIVSIEA